LTVKIQAAAYSQFNGLRTDTPSSNCPADHSPDCSDMVFVPNGMATRNPFRATVTLPQEIVYRKEFLCKDGTTQVVALGINGALYVVRADGSYTQVDAVTPGSKVNSVTAYGREYMAFFNDNGPCDAPRQWDGRNLARVSQGGPGAAPSFSAVAVSGTTYEISTITQPAPGFPGQLGNFDGILQSSGPGTTAVGNVVTVYTANARAGHFPGGDPVLTAAFNSGFPVNVVFSGLSDEFGPYNGTQLVTSIGMGVPPFAGATAERWYITFTVDNSSAHNRGGINAGITGKYQITWATLTMATPVPGLTAGTQIPISGASVADYDNTWTITQTLDSGTLRITQTSLSGGTATYHYAVSSGANPTAGQKITITNTLNANGSLNGENLTIATVAGGSSGTFTITGFDPSVTFPNTVETGSGTTAGTQFIFDPAAIFGDSTGGEIDFAGNAPEMASGTRLAVAFFITETGLTTAVGPIAKFTLPSNTNAIAFSGLPIGPNNVVARGIAFTGANGGNFFFLPIVPQVNGVVLGTSTVVNDNTTSSGTMNFTDQALFGGIAIDIPGNNLFQQVALNLPRGMNWYGDRMIPIGEANTVIGFLNMGMDGGTLSGQTGPLGWTRVGTPSISQTGFMPVLGGPGTISQPAAKTAQGAAILQPNLRYSLRAWLSNGSITATISSASTGFSSTATLTGINYVTANFSAAMPATIPDDMTFSVELGVVLIRDLQMIYADNPNRNPVARPSYIQNPEAYDALTGNIGPNDDSTELRATFVQQESLYFVTQRGVYYTQQIGNTEPSSWYVNRIADKCGAFNSNAVATGRGWTLWAGQEGVQWFSGQIPDKVSATIAPTWRNVANVLNIYDDPDFERVYIAYVDKQGVKRGLVADYHEVALGGTVKWCPWNRPFDWVCNSASGTIFVIGSTFYRLDTAEGTTDDNLGDIGGYYVFAAAGSSAWQKNYSQAFFEIDGVGILTPFVYASTLDTVTDTLKGQQLSTLIDSVAEWPMNTRGRKLWAKLGQAGVHYSLQSATIVYTPDPNAPVSGVR
jgi:hypothetical protein